MGDRRGESHPVGGADRVPENFCPGRGRRLMTPEEQEESRFEIEPLTILEGRGAQYGESMGNGSLITHGVVFPKQPFH